MFETMTNEEAKEYLESSEADYWIDMEKGDLI
jgi:hypothetical protein